MCCKHYAKVDTVDLRRKGCDHEGCSKLPAFGVEGSKAGVLCKQHAVDGMVDVVD